MEDKSFAYRELLHYFTKYDRETIGRIPKSLMQYFRDKADFSKTPDFDPNRPLSELDLTPECRAMIWIVAYCYFADTDEERKALAAKMLQNDGKEYSPEQAEEIHASMMRFRSLWEPEAKPDEILLLTADPGGEILGGSLRMSLRPYPRDMARGLRKAAKDWRYEKTWRRSEELPEGTREERGISIQVIPPEEFVIIDGRPAGAFRKKRTEAAGPDGHPAALQGDFLPLEEDPGKVSVDRSFTGQGTSRVFLEEEYRIIPALEAYFVCDESVEGSSRVKCSKDLEETLSGRHLTERGCAMAQIALARECSRKFLLVIREFDCTETDIHPGRFVFSEDGASIIGVVAQNDADQKLCRVCGLDGESVEITFEWDDYNDIGVSHWVTEYGSAWVVPGKGS